MMSTLANTVTHSLSPSAPLSDPFRAMSVHSNDDNDNGIIVGAAATFELLLTLLVSVPLDTISESDRVKRSSGHSRKLCTVVTGRSAVVSAQFSIASQ